jgi:O-antigen/teichoic acid export membrane protein
VPTTSELTAREDSTPAAPTRRLPGGLARALAAPLLIAVVLQNIGNLGLHAIMGRFLPAGDYGALGTILSLMVLLTVPLAALQAASSKAAASGARRSDRRSVLAVVAAAVLSGLGTAALAPAITAAFHLDGSAAAWLLAPFVGVSVALAVLRGRLLGLDGTRGVRVVAVTFVASTLVRLAVSVALLDQFGATAAIIGTLAGETVALVIAAAWVRRMSARTPGDRARWLSLRDVGWSGAAIGGLFLFTTVDLFLARHYLGDAESGAYVAAATIGKTLLALPAAALAAAYPRMVAAGRGPARLPELARTSTVVVGLAAISALVVIAVPGLVLDVLFGDSFDAYAPLVRLLALVAGSSAVVSVLTYALLAVGSRWSLLPLIGAGVQVALIAVWHDSAEQVAAMSLVGLAITLPLIIGAMVRDLRRRSATTEVPGALDRAARGNHA